MSLILSTVPIFSLFFMDSIRVTADIRVKTGHMLRTDFLQFAFYILLDCPSYH